MYITDARHFLDDKGAIAPRRGPAKAMADFHAGVIAYATDVSHDAADGEAPPAPGTPNNPSLDIYVHNVAANTDTLASRADGATGTDGNGYSAGPELTPDGRYVSAPTGETATAELTFERVEGEWRIASLPDGLPPPLCFRLCQ